MPVEVHVTAEDIAAGKPACAGACPVANALNRTSGRSGWFVTQYDIWCKGRWSIPLPTEVTGKISKYDTTGHMQPFSFTVPVEAL